MVWRYGGKQFPIKFGVNVLDGFWDNYFYRRPASQQ